jgi:hypothetical protein
MECNYSDRSQKLVFGSMRMLEYSYSLEYWVDLFEDLYDFGVTTFHSSNEYESFPFFCKVITVFQKKNPDKKIHHIIKIAEPHFNINTFDANLLEGKINEYCRNLNVSSIENIQWMWRGNLQNNVQREQLFDRNYPEIEKAILNLKKTNKIKKFYCFPYNLDFALSAIKKDQIDGLIVYRNVLEKEYDTALKLGAKLNKKSYIIRPLNAGKALSGVNQSSKSLVQWALNFPNIEGAIISISSVSRLKEII